MNRIGLALSGGGFRATLYHLGVVRFLRDAGVLANITHINCVSGGSILGAHLALNWDRYCGSPSEFDQAALEIIRFVQLDVRNRIVRRFPLTSSVNTVRRWLRQGSHRQWTRPGLLEQHYEKFLYGDISLARLPDHPRLAILSTNLSEGCLCAFDSRGLLLQRRVPGKRDRIERVKLDLATVAMAVTASSAFPGFFPPLELSGSDVGTDEGEFVRQAFTDGGVYDNLGLRMFRCIEQSMVNDIAPLQKKDFHDFESVLAAFRSSSELPPNTPIQRLGDLINRFDLERRTGNHRSGDDHILFALWEIIRSQELYRDPVLQNVELSDPNAESLLHYLRTSGIDPELNDRLWINRRIIESALSQFIGKPCLRMAGSGFDAILVSDAAGKFKVRGDGRAGGLIRTALRSSDILMDRVWQLELEAFESKPGILFFPITNVVEPMEDQTAPRPEIQRQAARIRTDLDRFSDLEVSALIQHGYCVSRKAFRSSNLFDHDTPNNAPWNPLQPDSKQTSSSASPSTTLQQKDLALPTSRLLRRSATRRTWSTILSLRDWPTYVWIPLLAILFLSIPYTLYKQSKRAQQQRLVLSAIAETSPVYQRLLQLLELGALDNQSASEFDFEFEEVDVMVEPNMQGYEVVSDARIYDMRGWSKNQRTNFSPYVYNRIRVKRTEEAIENTHLRFQLVSRDEQLKMRCRGFRVDPKFSRMKTADGSYLWELDLDMSRVPIGGDTEFILEGQVASELAQEKAGQGHFVFSVPLATGVIQVWLLMPEGRDYESFEMTGYPIGEPESARSVVPQKKVELPLGSIATFQFINPEKQFRYECRWQWRDANASAW